MLTSHISLTREKLQASITVFVLKLAFLVLLLPSVSADSVPVQLFTAASIPSQDVIWHKIGDQEQVKLDIPINPINAVWHSVLESDWQLFRFDFEEDYDSDGRLLQFYIDADANVTTGRKSQASRFAGVEYQITLQPQGEGLMPKGDIIVYNQDGRIVHRDDVIFFVDAESLYLIIRLSLAVCYDSFNYSYYVYSKKNDQAGNELQMHLPASTPRQKVRVKVGPSDLVNAKGVAPKLGRVYDGTNVHIPAEDVSVVMQFIFGVEGIESKRANALTWQRINLTETNVTSDLNDRSNLLNPIEMLWRLNTSSSRQILRIDLKRPFNPINERIVIYTDRDDNPQTGRTGTFMAGADFQVYIPNEDAASARVIYFDRKGQIDWDLPFPFVQMEGRHIYIAFDSPTDVQPENDQSEGMIHIGAVSQAIIPGTSKALAQQRFDMVPVSLNPEKMVSLGNLLPTSRFDGSLEPLQIDSIAVHAPEHSRGEYQIAPQLSFRLNQVAPAMVRYWEDGSEHVYTARSLFSGINQRIELPEIRLDTDYTMQVFAVAPDMSVAYSPELPVRIETTDQVVPRESDTVGSTGSIIVIYPDSIEEAVLAEEADVLAPLRVGFPFELGAVFSTKQIKLISPAGSTVPSQWTVMSRWPDNSIRWAQVIFRAQVPLPLTHQKQIYTVNYGNDVSTDSIAPLVVTESSQEILVDNGILRVAFCLQPFLPLSRIQIRSTDGQWKSVETGGLIAEIIDSEGGRFESRLATDDQTYVESVGSEQVVIRSRGHHRSESGAELLSYDFRFYIYRDLSVLGVEYVFGVDESSPSFYPLRSIKLKLETGIKTGSVVDDEGISFFTEGFQTLRQFQWLDNAWDLEHGGETVQSGEKASGILRVQTADYPISLIVPEFWQHYPKSLEIDRQGIALGIAPELEANQYDAPDLKEKEHVLFFPYRGGLYRFTRGFEKRHSFYIALGEITPAEEELLQNPPLVYADPQQIIDSKAMGHQAFLPEIDAPFDGYLSAVGDGLKKYRNIQQEQRLYGMMNYGDWFGERRYNWGNNEYDTVSALLQQFVAGAGEEFLEEAAKMARHYMDVDIIHSSAYPSLKGRVWLHTMGHTGGYYEGRWQGAPGFPGAFPHQIHNEFGHYWAEGLFQYYWLTGDRRAKEVGLQVADQVASNFINSAQALDYNLRNIGWNLRILNQAWATTSDPFYLNAATLIVDRVLSRQAPSGGFPRELKGNGGHIGPNTNSPFYGNVSFMVSVMLGALEQFHRETDRADLLEAIVRATRYMIDDFWLPRQGDFRYTSDPYFETSTGALHFLLPLVRAWQYSGGDPLFKDAAMRFTRSGKKLETISQMRTNYGVDYGKVFSQNIKEVPAVIKMLDQMVKSPDFRISGEGSFQFLVGTESPSGFSLRLSASPAEEAAIQVTLQNTKGIKLFSQVIEMGVQSECILELPQVDSGVYRLTLTPAENEASRQAVWGMSAPEAEIVIQPSAQTFFLPLGEVMGSELYPDAQHFDGWLRFRLPETTRSVRLSAHARVVDGEASFSLVNPDGDTIQRYTVAPGQTLEVDASIAGWTARAAGVGPRGALNENNRQWALRLHSGALSFALSSTDTPVFAASSLSWFNPWQTRAQIRYQSSNESTSTRVNLDGSESFSLGGEIESYQWEMGDGTSYSTSRITHEYRKEGIYQVTLTVTDSKGTRASAAKAIKVDAPELAAADLSDRITIEAEDFTEAQHAQRLVVTSRINASGNIITAWESFDNKSMQLTWSFDAPSEGWYYLGFRYASAFADNTRHIELNGQPVAQDVLFVGTGGFSLRADDWSFMLLRDSRGNALRLQLNEGFNKLVMGSVKGGIALDQIYLIPIPTP